jgi:hypothetical protein
VGIAVLGLGGLVLGCWWVREREERRDKWRREAVESVERRLEELGKEPSEERPEERPPKARRHRRVHVASGEEEGGARPPPAAFPGTQARREVAGAPKTRRREKKGRDVLGAVAGLGLAVLGRLNAKPKRSGRG